jgi:hypothetical protein
MTRMLTSPTLDTSANLETMLMIDEHRKMLMPLSTRALLVAQGTKAFVRNSNEGVLLVRRDGTVWRLEQIKFVGMHGETLLAKLASMLTLTRRITTRLSGPLPVTMSEIRSKVSRLLPAEFARGEPNIDFAEPLETLVQHVAQCSSCEEMFSVLNIPGPDDALDVL